MWLQALNGAELGADWNRIDFRIHPFHPIRVGWSWRNRLLSLLAQSELLSASPSVLQKVLLQPIVGVLKPGKLSWAPEEQGVVVVLAAEARLRKLRPDVGTGFVVVKPD